MSNRTGTATIPNPDNTPGPSEKASRSHEEAIVTTFPDARDFTVFMTHKLFQAACNGALLAPIAKSVEDELCYCGRVTLTDKMYRCEGRALICPCMNGEYVSLTLRRDDDLWREDGEEVTEAERKALELKASEAHASAFAAESWGEKEQAEWLVSAADLYQELHRTILAPQKEPQGVVVVAGSTGSGKTTAVRGIIHEYLSHLLQQQEEPIKRHPHFVAFEDPIEKKAYRSPVEAQRQGIDYTVRQKGSDVASLKDALLDARRQTPALFYIGEVRDESEWPLIMEFAGTGHLVITTTHAGSVTECMKKIFRAMKVRTPVDRNQIADLILGIAHLRSQSLSVGFEPARTAILPAVWRHTPSGVNALVSDGLASILPYNPGGEDSGDSDESEYSSLGRRWFAKRFLLKAQNYHSELMPGQDKHPLICDYLDKLAVGMDLEEM